jgi:phosphoribosylaminoimidazole carboxylase (NCAIR synthetase)
MFTESMHVRSISTGEGGEGNRLGGDGNSQDPMLLHDVIKLRRELSVVIVRDNYSFFMSVHVLSKIFVDFLCKMFCPLS